VEAAVSAESIILPASEQYRAVIERRLLDGIKRSPSGCWLWQKARNPKGYGQIGVRLAKWSYARQLTHRVAYVLFCGPVPAGLRVLHGCDMPSCCRPDHLFVGTDKDNTDDMIAKGRKVQLRGEEMPGTRLTSEQVTEIRRLYVPGSKARPGNGAELAHQFGVSKGYVSNIAARRKWKHVP
jgi:hypothetical protein